MLKKILEDYIEGKKILPMLKRLLSVIFVASATYFLLRRFNYKIHLVDFSDELKLFNFFIYGYFIIPAVSFFSLWHVTNFLFDIPFCLLNNFLSLKYKRKIINISITEDKILKTVTEIEPHLEKQIASKLKKDWYVTMYEQIKKEIKPATFKEMERGLLKAQKSISENVVFAGRGIIAISLYFICQPDFSPWLFAFILLFAIIYFISLLIGFQFTELLPIAAKKFQNEMEIYLRDFRKQENQHII